MIEVREVKQTIPVDDIVRVINDWRIIAKLGLKKAETTEDEHYYKGALVYLDYVEEKLIGRWLS